MMRRKACFYKGQGLSLKPAPPPFFLALLFLLSILLLVNPSGESAGVSSPTPYRWTAGECITYQLTYDSSSSSDFRVLFGDVKSSESKQKEMPSGLAFSFQTTVRGELTSTVLGKRGDSNLIVYRIRNPLVTLIVNGNNDTKQAEAVRRDLGKDLFILISPQGKVRSILIDPAMGNLAQSYARAMIALTQFVFPAGQIPESGQWKAQEEDPSGPYLAGYQVCKDKDTGNAEPSVKSFCKKKIRYLEYRPKTKTGPIEAPKTIIPEGEFIARFDFASGALSSLKGSESQVILVNNKKVGQVTNNFRIASLKKEMLKASEVASLKNLFSKANSGKGRSLDSEEGTGRFNAGESPG
jgi:hypothetical protein